MVDIDTRHENCYMVGESDVYTTTEGTHTINFKPIMTTLNIGVRGTGDANSVTVSGVRIYLKDASGKRIAFPDEITLNYQTLNYKQNGVPKSMVNCNYIDHAYDHSTVAGNEDIDMGSLDENSNIDPSKDNTTPYIEVRFSKHRNWNRDRAPFSPPSSLHTSSRADITVWTSCRFTTSSSTSRSQTM